ncbi:UNVERIFIED_CONTAM: hypothetical protein Sradi_3670900 [Sesamum radiatum]|uniref:Uncharacterized protein n=1 Tax=Sesamum radiatum TaxID=300843 RepID=A0AAW2QKL0_SESRA
MANLTKLDFIALDVSGTNYLSWVLDAELHLASNKLGETIKENTSASEQDCAKAMILLRHHLHESLKSQYLTVKSPFQLWKSLKDRFDHQKTQYRERGFKTYSELISCLLVAEENNQLLLNNHHTRPTGSKPLLENSAALPEANATSSRKGRGRYHGSPRAILMDVVVVMALVVVVVEMVVEIIIIHGLIPIFRRTMGTRQRINKRKLQMVIFAIDVGCLDIGPVPVVRHNI